MVVDDRFIHSTAYIIRPQQDCGDLDTKVWQSRLPVDVISYSEKYAHRAAFLFREGAQLLANIST